MTSAVIHQGVRTVSTGHGFCGTSAKQLLLDLQARALKNWCAAVF
ncbi:MAG: hypothetical protein R3E89_08155 [Thiolinea sp.]